MLSADLRERLQQKPILLMAHIVLGYPDFETSRETVAAMVDAGVDLMELQIPFSEPIADGPVILHANQSALKAGATVAGCFTFARQVAQAYPIPFLFMSYYNILFKYGVGRFAADTAAAGLKGAIVPDLPPEEAGPYLEAMERSGLAPIFIFSPTTDEARMRTIARCGRGFIYCVARKGVTGGATHFDEPMEDYLKRCRSATDLPLALGFGVKDKADVDFLKGKADIAVVGSETLRRLDREGVGGVRRFIRGLRDDDPSPRGER